METGVWISVLFAAVGLGYALAPKCRTEQMKIQSEVSSDKAAIKAELEALQWRVATDVRMTVAEIRNELASIGKRL